MYSKLLCDVYYVKNEVGLKKEKNRGKKEKFKVMK